MLSNIRIVLVNTSHPGNIGSAARAMKTMGLNQLYLVQPKSFPSAKATELAAGADDILIKAQVCDTLAEALNGCSLAVASSARPRGIPLPTLDPRQAAQVIHTESAKGEIAMVFGREHAGLTNEEILHCHQHAMIPANPEYSSLNLAQAVQVFCYEIRMASLQEQTLPDFKNYDELATSDEVERFYQHLERVLIDVNFLRPSNPRKLVQRIRRLFNRIRLEAMEVRILRGILTAIDKSLRLSEGKTEN